MKTIAIIGTRPEAIKLAPVLQEMKRRRLADQVGESCLCRGDIDVIVCNTGQHREMVDGALKLFGIVPDHDFRLMTVNQTPNLIAAAVLGRLGTLLKRETPDVVLVQGDTTSAMAASLAAFHTKVRVAHVEAGLRTYDKWKPFPEEINRRITSLVSDLHFAPTYRAQQNLLQEGASAEKVFLTGNPVVDALFWVARNPPPPKLAKLLRAMGLRDSQGDNMSDAGHHRTAEEDPRLVLVTAHRRENHGKPLEDICIAVREIAARYRGAVRIFYPVHMNPSVTEVANRVLARASWVTLAPPLDYASLVHLMKRSCIVLTDSGGIQEEAPSLGKPVLVLRQVTERPEAVEAGTVKIIGTDPRRILEETARLLEDESTYDRMAQAVNPYGDGQASRRIVSALLGEPFEAFDATCGESQPMPSQNVN